MFIHSNYRRTFDKAKTVFLFVIVSSLFLACTESEQAKKAEPKRNTAVQTTEGGLKYIHVESFEGPKAAPYQYIYMDFQMLAPDGEPIFTTYVPAGSTPEPQGVRLLPPPFPGAIEEALALLSPGDSMIIFQAATQALPNEAERPKKIKPTDEIRFCLRVYSIMEAAQYMELNRKRIAVKDASSAEREPEIIRKNVDVNELQDSVFELPEGLFFMIQKEGTGPCAQDGDSIIMHYNTRLLNGLTVDDSQKMQGKPFGFVFDRTNPKRGLIPAWEIIFGRILNKGSVGVFWSPSHLAFGSSKKGNLGAYQSLQFQFYILDIVPKNQIKGYKKNFANLDNLLDKKAEK
ncbi:MAG: hypothetical protein EAZ57_02815 [Cytophagales bacterium]|nr:MAG: hypothetical protein EAZ67_03280 [Cytophagales bacterium]TAF61692.1 MAG: hypothetical protein EAZ57_02815 [Cytophagales bacterium]